MVHRLARRNSYLESRMIVADRSRSEQVTGLREQVTPILGVDETTILRKKLELKRRLLDSAKEFGLPFYKPHDKQLKFHLNQSKYRAVFAGNRFGKSQCGVAEDCSWIIGERMFLPKDHPGRTLGIPKRPVKGLVLCADWDKSEEIFTCESSDPHLTGKVWKNLSRGFVKKISKNASGKIDRIEFHNGSVLAFDTVKSFMNNPVGLESSDWDFIHIDEPIPQAMWKAVSRGLIDRNGRAWFTLTNLDQPWIYTMFFPKGTQKVTGKEVVQKSSDGTPLRWAIVGSIYDNPYLSREAIDAYESELSAEEKQCRLHGLAMHLSGLVYKEFQYDKHVLTKLPDGWTAFNRPPRNYTIHYAIDTHPRKPHEVLFAASSPEGRLYFFHEIFEACLIAELAQKIRDVIEHYPTLGLQICEPGAWITNPVNGRSMSDVFIEDFQLCIEPAVKDLHAGVLATKAALACEDFCFFSPDLPNFFGEIMQYGWNNKTDKDKPVDVNDHAMECFYRLILSNPEYINPKGSDIPIKDEEFGTADLGDIE